MDQATLMRASEILQKSALAEIGGGVKPQKPLTPAQARKRSERQVRLQQRMHDEQARHVAKIRDLRSQQQ